MAITNGLDRFFADPERVEQWHVQFGAYDPATDGEVTHGFAYNGDETGYPAVIASITPYQVEALASRDLLGLVADPVRASGGGVIRLLNDRGRLDYLRTKGYIFDGRAVTIWAGGYFSDGTEQVMAPVRLGIIVSVDVGITEVVVTFRDLGERLERPASPRRFHGSDWALYFNGGDRVSIGTPTNLQLSGYGAVTWFCRFRVKTLASQNGIASWRTNNGGVTTAWPWSFGVNVTTGKVFFSHSGATTLQTTATCSTEVVYVLAVTANGTTVTVRLVDMFAAELTVNREALTLTSGNRPAPAGGTPQLWLASHNGTDAGGLVLDWLYVADGETTDGEVLELARRQLSAAELGDVRFYGAWRIEDGSGTTIADASANGYTGTFAGSPAWVKSLEGGASLEGTAKRDYWGRVERAECVLVDSFTRIYLVSGYKSSAINGVTEGGAADTFGTAYTDQETFLAATTTAAQYDTLIWAGGTFIRLGSDATRPLAVDISGSLDHLGSFASTPAEIITAVWNTRVPSFPAFGGGVGVDLDVSADLTAAPQALGIPVGEDWSLRDLIGAVLRSVGGMAWWSRVDTSTLYCKLTCKLFTALPATGYSVATTLQVSPGVPEPQQLDPPPAALVGTYKPNPVPLTPEQQSTAIMLTAAQRDLELGVQTATQYIEMKRLTGAVQTVDTYLTTRADAQAELRRQAAFFRRGVPQLLKLPAPANAYVVDMLDFVRWAYVDADEGGNLQSRLNIGRPGRCQSYLLNGTSSQISLGTTITALAEFTVEVVFRCTLPASGFRVLSARQNSSSDRNWWLGLWDAGTAGNQGGALVARWSAGGVVGNLAIPCDIRDLDWHTATLAFNDKAAASLCLDGISVATRTDGLTVDSAAGATTYIGSEGGSRFWAGDIAEFRLWNYARSADEVWRYRHGLPASAVDSSLLSWLRFTGGSGAGVASPVTPIDRGSLGVVPSLTACTAYDYGPAWYDAWRVVGISDNNDPADGSGEVELDLWRPW